MFCVAHPRTFFEALTLTSSSDKSQKEVQFQTVDARLCNLWYERSFDSAARPGHRLDKTDRYRSVNLIGTKASFLNNCLTKVTPYPAAPLLPPTSQRAGAEALGCQDTASPLRLQSHQQQENRPKALNQVVVPLLLLETSRPELS